MSEIRDEDKIKDEDKELSTEEICARCSVVLVKPTFHSSSGHEICSPCHDTEALLQRNLEIESESDEESVGDSEEEYADAIGIGECSGEDREKTDEFECYEMYQSSASINQNRSGSIRPHTFGGGEKKRSLIFGCGSGMMDAKDGLTDDSNDELKITMLRPPEHKKSFIDMITQKLGLNMSYNSSEDDLEDAKSEYSDEVEESEILEEVFKKISICSLDSGKSGASSVKYKPVVCPLESCFKHVSVSELVQHFLLHHSKISLENVECNETLSFVVESSSIRTQKITHEKIFVIDNESNEDKAYFVFNITRQCFDDMDIVLIWISKVKANTAQYLCKIRARNAKNERAFFGPISNHHDPLVVFQNGDCLVIPITFFESFKEKEDGLFLNVTFFVGSEDGIIEDIGDRNRPY